VDVEKEATDPVSLDGCFAAVEDGVMEGHRTLGKIIRSIVPGTTRF
jgi:hypothetical protein